MAEMYGCVNVIKRGVNTRAISLAAHQTFFQRYITFLKSDIYKLDPRL